MPTDPSTSSVESLDSPSPPPIPPDQTIPIAVDQSSLSQFAASANTTPATINPDDNLPSDAPAMSPPPPTTSWWSRHRRGMVIFLSIVGLVLVTGGLLGLYTSGVILTLKTQASTTQIHARGALDQFKGQNLPATEEELKQLQAGVAQLQKTYRRLAFYGWVPVVGNYYRDGQHALTAAEAGVNAGLKTIQAVTPYADVLGFSGEGSFTGGTAENRVKLILQTLEKVTPELDKIAQDLLIAQTELSYIDERRYPEAVGGLALRSQIKQAKDGLNNSATILADFRPIIEQLPKIAGADGQRKKYLVLFQNDNELRPTGGFLTAYSVIFIENGVVTPEKSDDIYELDKKFTKKIPIPEALGRYLTTEKYFHLRDMNTSPDFKLSMDQFFEHYREVRGEPGDIDGIIALDTHVLNDLVKIVGPITISGFGTFSADNDPRCDCPQIIYALSEIITRPTPYLRQDRKGILAPLMQAILQRIYQSPRTFMSDLFQVGLNGVNGRHLQMYFFDPDFQQAAEAIHAAGRLENPEQASDFLAIVDANLGGAKSNLFVTHEVRQQINPPENGQLTKSVEIIYKNPRKGDNCNLEAGLLCLNATLRDWNRIYLPAGSKLVEAKGFIDQVKEYEEADFHVIDGFFTLEPLGQAKIQLTYTVPYQDVAQYRVKLWKQGGTDAVKHMMEVNGNQEEILVDRDRVYQVKFE